MADICVYNDVQQIMLISKNKRENEFPNIFTWLQNVQNAFREQKERNQGKKTALDTTMDSTDEHQSIIDEMDFNYHKLVKKYVI